MYRKVLLSSFHNGKVKYCTTSGSGDIEENASPVFFYSDFRKNNSYLLTDYISTILLISYSNQPL